MMDQALRDLPKQFAYEPVVENADVLVEKDAFIIGAMGGSAHSGALAHMLNPRLDVVVHRGYGLPVRPRGDLEQRLALAVSYSGNTEEVVDFYGAAKERGLPLGVVAKGGKLIELAGKDSMPYVQFPDTGIQPRAGLGFTLRAQMKLMGDEAGLAETAKLKDILDCEACEAKGKALAERLTGKVPIIYASKKNGYIAYNWKIKFNETGKIPAYKDEFSELNHNEMHGYDVLPSNRGLSENFHFIFLRDDLDHPRIKKRMDVTKQLYEDRGFSVEEILFEGASGWERIFTSLLIADWTAYYTAIRYGAEPEEVPMIEEFKQRIR